MTYTVSELAKLSRVSTRTLRYYDQIGLLKPKRDNTNDYRVYTEADIDRLQQILFYRELGMVLEEIKSILLSRDFDRGKALECH